MNRGLMNIGRSASTTTKEYKASYYAGTDIRIYFGDVWVDEIVEIEFSLMEQVAPVFGYASYTWDAVARGNRMVQGSFSINFKEAGYLQLVLNSLTSELESDNEYFNVSEYEAQKNTTVEDLISNFDEMASQFENALWSPGEDNKFTGIGKSRKKGTYFYGDVSSHTETGNSKMKDDGFNILLTYGGACVNGRLSDSANTMQSIMGVQITGVSQRVDPSGMPVQEIYTFIAKDLTGDVRNKA